MAEEPDLANNAQMGSVAGHPLWERVMRLLERNTAQGLQDPLYATGPRVITAAFRVRHVCTAVSIRSQDSARLRIKPCGEVRHTLETAYGRLWRAAV